MLSVSAPQTIQPNLMDYIKDLTMQKLFWKKKAPGELIRYLGGLAKPLYQGQLKGTLPKKAQADDMYKDLKTTEFTIQLSANQYMNFHSVHLVFPLKIK